MRRLFLLAGLGFGHRVQAACSPAVSLTRCRLGRFVTLAVVVCVLLSHRGAESAVLMVTNGEDSGPGSLREAIALSEDGDSIMFHPSIGSLDVQLKTQLLIEKSLAITRSPANAQQEIVISGSGPYPPMGDHRIFEIVADISVTLSGLILRRGGLELDPGGAVLNHGTLLLQHCTVSDNVVVEGSGGGIANLGHLEISDSSLTRNEAGTMTFPWF